jgi:hypothetical protein
MHIALARGKRTVVLFGPTSSAEIEMYGLGEKVVPAMACLSCYKTSCDFVPNCMDLISTEMVEAAVVRQLAICRAPHRPRRRRSKSVHAPAVCKARTGLAEDQRSRRVLLLHDEGAGEEGAEVSLATVEETDPRAVDGVRLAHLWRLADTLPAGVTPKRLPWAQERFRSFWGCEPGSHRIGPSIHRFMARRRGHCFRLTRAALSRRRR